MNFKHNIEQKEKVKFFTMFPISVPQIPAMMDNIHVNSQFWVCHILCPHILVDPRLCLLCHRKNFYTQVIQSMLWGYIVIYSTLHILKWSGYTFRERQLLFTFPTPQACSEQGAALKRKKIGSKFFPFRVDSLSKGDSFSGKQTGSHNSCLP